MKRKKKKAVSGFTRKALACALAYVFAFSAISPSYAMAAEMAAPAVATVDASIDQPAATIVDGHKESADSLEDDAVGGQDDQAISAENGLEDVEGAGASEPVKAPESHAVTSSTNVSKESLAQDNEQTVSIKWRDTGDDMISIGDDDSLSVDIDETREYSDLSVGVIVEWTSSGSKDYEPGEVEIGIPDHLFMGRDGEPYETVYELIYGTVPVATAKTGLEVDLGVPEAPEKSADGWQYRHDEDSHEYIIVNADHVGAGTKFVCEVNYNYSTAGGYYYGLTYDDKVHYVLSELTNDPVYLYAQINGSDKKQIGPATIETHSDLDSVEVEMEGAYDDWKPAWGIQEPSSPGQSLYVVWRVSALYAYAYQPHNLNLNAGNAPMGEIIGISDVWQWNDYKAGTGLDPEACVFNEPSNANTSIGNAERGSGGEGLIASIAILVRYDKDAIDAMNGIVELTLSAEAIMETADWGDQSVEGSGLFTYQPLGFDAPPGNAFKLKQATGAPELVESSLYFYQEGQVERLENGLATATGVDTSAAYASCLGATLGEGLDPTNIVNYGKRSYTVELVNDSAYIDDTRLGPDEYEMSAVLDINSVAVTLYEGVPDYEAGQYTTRPIEGSINPLDVTLYVQNGGEGVWVPAARWTQTENSLLDCAAIEPLAEGVEIREFDPASVIDLWYSSDKLSAYDGKQRCDIILPEGTTGVKIGFETTAWAASIGDMDPGHSDPQYGLTVASSILASERLQAHAASSTTVGCYKASTLVAHDDNGVLLGFQGEPSGIGKNTALAKAIAASDEERYGAQMYHDVAPSPLKRVKRSSGSSAYALKPQNDTVGKKVDIRNCYAEVSFSTTTREDDLSGLPASVQSPEMVGTFYLLLPQGFSADTSTLRAAERLSGGNPNEDPFDLPIDGGAVRDERSKTTNPAGGSTREYSPLAEITSVEAFPNWRDSGRELLRVSVRATSDSKGYSEPFDSNARYVSGFILSFGGSYSWDAMADYGTSPKFCYAYMSGNDDMAAWGGRTNASPSDVEGGVSYVGGDWTDEDRMLLSDLCGDASSQPRWLYCKAQSTLNFPTSAEYGLKLSAKAAGENIWHDASNATNPITIYPNSVYQYRLRAALEEGSTSTGNVLYDSIESYRSDGIQSSWRGSVQDIDVSQIRSIGVDPVVYYSTIEELDLNLEENRDISNASIWTTAKPSDPSAITAIAIDCTKGQDGADYELQEKGVLIATITMKSPSVGGGSPNESYVAYNQAWLSSTVRSATGATSDRILHHEYTAINLQSISFGFSKADSEGITAKSDGAAVDGSAYLSGAEFTLYKAKTDDIAGIVDVNSPDETKWEFVGDAVSDPDVLFEGLAPGQYRLVETKAPDGYKKPSGQWDVKLDPMLPAGCYVSSVAGVDGSQPPAFATTEDGSLVLANVAVPSIPITGATGTGFAALCGISAILLGSVISCAKRRIDASNAEDEAEEQVHA